MYKRNSLSGCSLLNYSASRTSVWEGGEASSYKGGTKIETVNYSTYIPSFEEPWVIGENVSQELELELNYGVHKLKCHAPNWQDMHRQFIASSSTINCQSKISPYT